MSLRVLKCTFVILESKTHHKLCKDIICIGNWYTYEYNINFEGVFTKISRGHLIARHSYCFGYDGD